LKRIVYIKIIFISLLFSYRKTKQLRNCPCLRLVFLLVIITINSYMFSYRGLSPHKLTPLPGVHKAIQPITTLRLIFSLGDNKGGNHESRREKRLEPLYRRYPDRTVARFFSLVYGEVCRRINDICPIGRLYRACL